MYIRSNFDGATISANRGDVNGDGVLASADARVLLGRMLVIDSVFTEPEYKTADMNDDGAINTSDIRVILRMLVLQ